MVLLNAKFNFYMSGSREGGKIENANCDVVLKVANLHPILLLLLTMPTADLRIL